jgi:hypothetical protein
VRAAAPAKAPRTSPALPALSEEAQATLRTARSVPDFVLRREAVAQPALDLSPATRAALRSRGRLLGIYRLCVGTEGSVVAVVPVQGVAEADAEVVADLTARWRYRPQPQPLCALVSVPIEP